MAYSLAFFPMVGALTGGLIALLNGVFPMSGLPVAVRILLTLGLPLFITGGIHVDGFLDVEDALHSYAPAEKKLEILKDPHIGAFAVICLIKWMLLYAAALSAIILHPETDLRILALYGLVFVLSRSCSGLTSLYFKKARSEGMLYEEAGKKPGSVQALLWVWLIAAAGAMLFIRPVLGGLILLWFAVWTVLYHGFAQKQFGGVTGDTAGYYLVVGQILATVVLSAGLYVL